MAAARCARGTRAAHAADTRDADANFDGRRTDCGQLLTPPPPTPSPALDAGTVPVPGLADTTARGDATSIAAAPHVRVLAVAVTMMLLGGATLFAGLGRYPLWEPDEARHAEIAREMAGRGAWIVPTLHGRPYHHKPILYYWLTATAYRVGGADTAMARVVSATAALLTVGVVFAWAHATWGLSAAALSALTLLTTIEFVALGRFGDLNMLLTLWVTIGVLGVHRWVSRDGHGVGLLAASLTDPPPEARRTSPAPRLATAATVLRPSARGSRRILRGETRAARVGAPRDGERAAGTSAA